SSLRALFYLCAPREFHDSSGLDAGVLADVERVQMEAERLYLAQERVEQQPRQPCAAVGDQAVAYPADVGGEGVCIRVGMDMGRRVAGRAQAVQDKGQIAPIDLFGGARC